MVRKPWIECMEKDTQSILARDENAYYIIKVGNGLDSATAEWLEMQGVSEALLKELQLPFEYIPKKLLRSVAFSGFASGETMYLYLKKGKRVLELAEKVEKSFIRDFFPGVPRSTAPKESPRRKKPESWREARRDAALYRKLKPVPVILGGCSAMGAIGYIFRRSPFWLTILLLGMTIPVLLDILMPAYFTLFFEEKGKKREALGLDFGLFVTACALILRSGGSWLEDVNFWLVAGGCGLAGAAVCLLAEEFRRSKLALLAVFFYAGTFGVFGVEAVNRVYDRSEPTVYELEVNDTHKSDGRNTTYYCTVLLPGYGERSLRISRSLYDDLEAGALVQVEVRDGALGIEYANVNPYKEEG